MENFPEDLFYNILSYLCSKDTIKICRLKPKDTQYVITYPQNILFKYCDKMQNDLLINSFPYLNNIITPSRYTILHVDIQKLIKKYNFHDKIFDIHTSLYSSKNKFIVIFASNNSQFIIYIKNFNKLYLLYEMNKSNIIFYIMFCRNNIRRDYGVLFKTTESITPYEFDRRMFYLN